MENEQWVISGKPDGTFPVIGALYEIRDSRKGKFIGKILEVNDIFATVEVVRGLPKFASVEYNLGYNGIVSIRASLCYLIETEVA